MPARDARPRPGHPPFLPLLSLLLLLCACPGAAPVPPGGPVAGWPSYGGDPGGTRYSPLRQITPENVGDLEVAWTFRTGDSPEGRGKEQQIAFQATPILDGDTLYFCSPLSRLFALDARTGEERWSFDGQPDLSQGYWNAACRGVALWRDPAAAPDAPCARRVYMGTLSATLVAVDAATGAPCRDFGEAGRVDLTRGIGDIAPGEYYPTSPPLVVGDVVSIGALVGDGRRVAPPGGVVRGFDLRTGALRWAFDPVPPGTPPPAPGPEGERRFHRGTPNAWSIFSADPERRLLFVPTGNPSPDFYGGERDGIDHFGSSVVALDADTGAVVWRYQTVHHDLWDYDVASQPTLLELEVDGVPVPALAQPTKMGHVFLLHRETGAPLYPVEERPVPQGGAEGEILSPTQPFPTFPPPLHPGTLEPEDAFGLTPWDRAACRERLAALRYEGIFTPPSEQGTLLYPGTPGGFNWGGAAWDPERKLLVLNQSRIGQSITLIRRDALGDPSDYESEYAGVMTQTGLPFAAFLQVVVSPLGIPCTPPPWGTLLAVDLASGELRWEVPFGTTRDVAPVPIALHLGLPNMGGPLATASGLLFIGASVDDYLRAYDVETGEELWRARLPAGGQATPMTYRLDDDGRQFVVIAAGGHATLRTRLGDSLIAFALP